jgi:hypothetical protein
LCAAAFTHQTVTLGRAVEGLSFFVEARHDLPRGGPAIHQHTWKSQFTKARHVEHLVEVIGLGFAVSLQVEDAIVNVQDWSRSAL